MASSAKLPLVAVIGTTGVGKSQLSIELALAASRCARPGEFAGGGEVINSDSIQVYRGLDVITNKVTEEEKRGVKHHLMAFLGTDDEYSVGQFQADAMRTIDELSKENKLPVVVGGTTYYLQHLLFLNSLVADAPPPSRPSTPPPANEAPKAFTSEPLKPHTLQDIAHFPDSLRSSIASLPAELLELFLVLPSLPQTSTPAAFPPRFPLDCLPMAYQTPEEFTSGVYALLTALDPESAARWHWRDIRKVRRALEIVWEGRRWADVRELQQARENDERAGPRYRALVFWLFAEKSELDERLDNRVDRMLELGLMDEIEELWKGRGNKGADYSKGIYQTIGYKEFEPFLIARDAKPQPDAKELDRFFADGLERMKISTRQYAKRQVKWISSKLLPEVRKEKNRDEVAVVLLDATDLTRWEENVSLPAADILQKFLREERLPDPTTLSELAAIHLAPSPDKSSTGHIKRICEVCTIDPSRPFLVEEHQWNEHQRTKAHRKRTGSAFKARGRLPPQEGDTLQ